MLKSAVFGFTLLLLLAPANAAIQDWPPEAQTFLSGLPGKTLSLETVVQRALNSADIFQLHKTEAYQAEAVYFNVVSLEDFKLTGSYSYFDQRNEPLVPQFMATSTKGWEAKVGAEQFLPTGTLLSVEGMHTPKDIGFQSQPLLETIESKLSFTLSQNILGDFLGSGYRGLKRSAAFSRQALQEGVLSKVENSTVDIITLYYQAWLKKESALNLLEGKKRKDKLAKISKSQQRRGVIEQSDLLQIEGAALNSELEYINTKRDLQTIWEQLVISLKLPRSFLKVDPTEIPMVLDAPETKSKELCAKATFSDLEKNSTQIKAAVLAVQAAEEKYKSVKQRLMPDVKILANYSANSIESNVGGNIPQSSQTFSEVGEFDNPALTAGVSVSFPLQNRQQKAQYLTAKMELEQAQLKKSMLLGDLEAKWMQLCKTLDQKIDARDKYKLISSKNKQRVNLDNRRFEVGRIKSLQWVQTEDDEAMTTQRYQLAEVEVRLTAWDIQRQTGHMIDQIKTIVPVKFNE